MRNFRVAPGQTTIPGRGTGLGERANGLSLKKTAPECRDLILWEDGTVAAGVRPIGAGYAVHLGLEFCHRNIWWDGREATKSLFRHVLDWRGVEQLPARVEDGLILRHTVSNNGLYDLYVMWNTSDKYDVATDLVFAPGMTPAYRLDVRTGKQVPLTKDDAGWRLRGLSIPPLEMQMYLTPRGKIASAPFAWFTLQRNWWRGTKEARPLRPFERKYALDLTEDWAFTPLEGIPFAS